MILWPSTTELCLFHILLKSAVCSNVCVFQKTEQCQPITAVFSNRNQTQQPFTIENDSVCGYSVQHCGLFHVVHCISDHTAEDSQQSLCKGLQGLWPRGLVSCSLKLYSLAGIFPCGVKYVGEFCCLFYLTHVTRWVEFTAQKNTMGAWHFEITGYCLKVNRLCFSVIDKLPDTLVIVTME